MSDTLPTDSDSIRRKYDIGLSAVLGSGTIRDLQLLCEYCDQLKAELNEAKQHESEWVSVGLLIAERDQLKAEVERLKASEYQMALAKRVVRVHELTVERDAWHDMARELNLALGNGGVETNNDLSELARNNALARFNDMEKNQL